MDTTMPIPPIFDLPELLALIASYLRPSDMVHCSATSRGMSRAFEPLLYKHFYLHKALLSDSTALVRNRHHLQSIDIRFHNAACLQALACGLPADASTDKRLPCTNLRRIALADFSLKMPPPLGPYFALLHSNDRLTYLQIPGQFLRPTGNQDVSFSVTLGCLQNLQHLTVGMGDVPIQSFLDFLIAALGLPQLKELYCKFTISASGDTPLPLAEQALEDFLAHGRLDASRKDPESASRRRPVGSKITALQLPYVEQAEPETLLLPLLKLDHLFDLERFFIPCLGLQGGRRLTWFQQALEEWVGMRLSRVQHLCCPSPELTRGNTFAVLDFIRACCGLRSFSGEWFCNEDSFMNRLPIIDALLNKHADTLEEIELPRCVTLESMDVKAILTRCRRLRRLWIWPSSFGQSALKFVDASTEEWVCSGLTELSLSLGRATRTFDMPARASDDEEREMAHKLARQVYARIGRLSHLTALALGCDGGRHAAMNQKEFEWDLTVSRGWLTELAGLKKLRALYLRSNDLWARIGQEEVEFMLTQWPDLEFISLGAFEEKEVRQSKALPHWQWLTRERPWLRLVYSESGVMEH